MNQPKKEGSQFESGFGGSVFGGSTGIHSQITNPANGSMGVGGAGGGGAGPSEFGAGTFGGTNAVSQIFKDSNEDKKKKMINIALISGCVLAIVGAGYFFFMDSTPEEPTIVAPAATTVAPATAAATDDAAEDDEIAEDDALVADEATAAKPAPVSGKSSSWTYNDEAGGPVVTVAAGTLVEVSRNENFSGSYVAGKANEAGKFRIPAPPAGKIFWRQGGTNSVNAITVNPAKSLGLSFSAPPALDPGAALSWSSGQAAFYRVELSTDGEFSSISNTFSTKEQTVAIKDVGAGKYFVRVGGFNAAAGKWEWSKGSAVEIK